MVMLCCEGQKELEGIPIGFDCMEAGSPDVGKVSVEELMKYG
jgi:hypothetical protein